MTLLEGEGLLKPITSQSYGLIDPCNFRIFTKSHQLPIYNEMKIRFSKVLLLLLGGCDAWKESVDEIKNIYIKKFVTMPTNTHMTERGVKEMSNVATSYRNEALRTQMSTLSKGLIPEVNLSLMNDDDRVPHATKAKKRQ